ncbi:uncharacterized protein LOC18015242 isoform X2 [Eutrema salsugineum]|uniref:uncharacterized protein LOC18015242 isoform X2 n=1 Tax=Eutrema salsugineum TaxID=72664 RepID=UPI000CED0250|nr:uncharacterized protein LOC18015242 isoform X2 [Eutrema salsugineum]
MRIRKNTKLSSMLLATAGYGGERPETYVCHLNQSPWDVIPLTSSDDGDDAAELFNLIDSSWFLPSPSSSSPPLIHQFDGEDSSNGNVSLGDSNGASESLVSVERLNLVAAEDYDERSPDVEDPMDRSDNSDHKSKAVEPNSRVKTSGDDEQVTTVSMPAPPKRGRPRGTAKKAPAASNAASTNPYEFYYYSGFGPRWGRKRSGSGDEKNVIIDCKKSCEDNMSKKSSSSGEDCDKTAAFGDGSSSFDGFEYMREADYDGDSDHGKKKEKTMMMVKKTKRTRKPVKERSLKSLM